MSSSENIRVCITIEGFEWAFLKYCSDTVGNVLKISK
jgi:hypothetical protein